MKTLFDDVINPSGNGLPVFHTYAYHWNRIILIAFRRIQIILNAHVDHITFYMWLIMSIFLSFSERLKKECNALVSRIVFIL